MNLCETCERPIFDGDGVYCVGCHTREHEYCAKGYGRRDEYGEWICESCDHPATSPGLATDPMPLAE